MGIKNVVEFSQVKIKILKVAIFENSIYSKVKSSVVFKRKVLSLGPNQVLDVRPNSLAKPNVWSVTIDYGQCPFCTSS